MLSLPWYPSWGKAQWMVLAVAWGFRLLPVVAVGLWYKLPFEQFDISTKFQLGMLKRNRGRLRINLHLSHIIPRPRSTHFP